jgi:hypothetical protein
MLSPPALLLNPTSAVTRPVASKDLTVDERSSAKQGLDVEEKQPPQNQIQMKTSTILTSITRRSSTNAGTQTIASRQIDISRGAGSFGVRAKAVFIESNVLDDYAEIDFGLGQNVVGNILSVLRCHLSAGFGGRAVDTITVSLLRRDDAQIVELDLEVNRARQGGVERLLLRKVTEREINFESAL